MEKIVDLHMHTIYSDGKLMPNDLVKLAYDNGIDIISITDHDSVLGLKSLKKTNNIKVINGIEMTSYYENTSIHILGYGIDINNENLNKKLEEIRKDKFYLMMRVITLLKEKYNIIFSSNDISNYFNSKGTISRVGLAQLCVKNNYASNIQEAFSKYLNNAYELLDGDYKRMSPKECIDLIHQAGGICSVAHLFELKVANKEQLICDLKEMGIDALEAYHSMHSIEDINKCLEYANKYDLLVSGGSDYHGEDLKKFIPISFAKDNNLTIDKLTILNKLEDSYEL